MIKPTQAQIKSSIEIFNAWISDWLEERRDSISTKRLVELILLAAINTEE